MQRWKKDAEKKKGLYNPKSTEGIENKNFILIFKKSFLLKFINNTKYRTPNVYFKF